MTINCKAKILVYFKILIVSHSNCFFICELQCLMSRFTDIWSSYFHYLRQNAHTQRCIYLGLSITTFFREGNLSNFKNLESFLWQENAVAIVNGSCCIFHPYKNSVNSLNIVWVCKVDADQLQRREYPTRQKCAFSTRKYAFCWSCLLLYKGILCAVPNRITLQNKTMGNRNTNNKAY